MENRGCRSISVCNCCIIILRVMLYISLCCRSKDQQKGKPSSFLSSCISSKYLGFSHTDQVNSQDPSKARNFEVMLGFTVVTGRKLNHCSRRPGNSTCFCSRSYFLSSIVWISLKSSIRKKVKLNLEISVDDAGLISQRSKGNFENRWRKEEG